MKFVKVDYDLNRAFPIPSELSQHKVCDTNLIIAPKLPAWTAVCAADADVINRLSKGATLEDALLCLRSWNVDQASERLSELLSRLAVEGFLEGDESAACRRQEMTLQLHITNGCNLKCKHCYVSSGAPLEHEMALEKWIEIIDNARSRYKNLYVGISGGEPLLVPWLSDLVAYTRSREIRTALPSNGMLWTEKRIREIGKSVDLVNVSLDGATAEVHDEVRGRGSFRQAMRGLRRIGSAGIEVGINICLMKSNIRDIEENLYGLVESFPFKVSVIFGKFVEEGRGRDIRSQQMPPEELARVLPKLASQFLGSGWQPTSLSRRRNCGFGQSYAIYANGDVSPCLSPIYIAGNVLSEPVGAVFDRLMARSAKSDVDELPLCRTCDLRYICGGGCHLPQLKRGLEMAQNECSADFRERFRERLAIKAQKHEEVALQLMPRPM
ncbi:radical SAM protein with 4Fe4S-binding SPASM domain [Bradyrhizobium sp. LB12.1]|uniref:radical SAM/SPASM domain-containing protein n=1 Tax=Bradyrhizobium sp. LB12.1 TaxID=3156327 RepID=UPI0033908DF4